MRMLRRFLGRTRGAVIVEFALVVPIFMTLVWGIIMFSRSYTRLNALNSSLREGARYASAMPTTVQHRDSVTLRVRQFSQAFGFPIDTSAGVLTVTFGAADVTVGVTNYPIFAGLTTLFGLSNIQVSRSAIFRWEYAP